MRNSFLALCSLLFVGTILYAQPKGKPAGSPATPVQPKTITGKWVTSVSDFKASPDGNYYAIGYNPIYLIDVQKGTVREIPSGWSLSNDLRYRYTTGHFPDTRAGQQPNTIAYAIKVAGVFADTAERTVFLSTDSLKVNRLLAVDGQAGRILVSHDPSMGEWAGFHLLDLKTGKLVKTLRQDTFYASRVGPITIANMNYIVFERRVILPLDSGDLAVIRADGYFNGEMADDNYIYMLPLRGNNDLIAYDRRTGETAATHSFPSTAERQMLYAFFNNRVYRHDRSAATVYEEEVRGNNFVQVASYKVDGFSAPAGQFWKMVVRKGPSVMFLPASIDPAEAGGLEANTATLIALSTGKTDFTISPFYVRTASILAKQQADKKASDERWAAHQAEEAKKKADKCKAAWGNADFNRGITRLWGVLEKRYVILESYNCEKDQYRIWQPDKDDMVVRLWGKYNIVSGAEFRASSKMGDKQYETCGDCDGDGTYEVTEYTVKTKDLPWGYFSGIETKSIKTTSTTREKFCDRCKGKGVVLR